MLKPQPENFPAKNQYANAIRVRGGVGAAARGQGFGFLKSKRGIDIAHVDTLFEYHSATINFDSLVPFSPY